MTPYIQILFAEVDEVLNKRSFEELNVQIEINSKFPNMTPARSLGTMFGKYHDQAICKPIFPVW